MRINSVKKLTALVLTGAAVAVAAETGAQAVAAPLGDGALSAISANQGNPNAVPPILPPLRPSELAELRREEARKLDAFDYRLPATARYSDAEMNAFAAEGYGVF